MALLDFPDKPIAMPNSLVVIKFGSSSLTEVHGQISHDRLAAIVRDIDELKAKGVDVVLVSSGAIAAGRGAMPGNVSSELSDLQALAAIGQSKLMAAWGRAFEHGRHTVAQILLTAHDFGDRTAYLSTKATIERLRSWNAIAIINENDTTATEEITLGDNDRLSALVASLLGAQLLLILTDTPGVFASDPRLDHEAPLIEDVTNVDRELRQAAGGPGEIGTGGMVTKIAAAKIASWSGVPCVIAGAETPSVIQRVWDGERLGTRIHPRTPTLSARKVWIAFARRPSGTIVIDAGAARALTAGGGSLLSVGVKEVHDDFEAGDAIDIVDGEGNLVAKGIARLGAHDGIIGVSSSSVVVVHRNDLVIFHGQARHAVD